MSQITQLTLARVRRMLSYGDSVYEVAIYLKLPHATARLAIRMAHAGLRYNEPAPVFLSDDEIRRRLAENGHHSA